MSEMALTAEHLVVIGRGRLIADVPVAGLLERASRAAVRVHTPDDTRLRALLAGPGVAVTALEAGVLDVEGLSARDVGEVASRHGLVLHEMTPHRATLEEAFMALTRDAVEFDAGEPAR